MKRTRTFFVMFRGSKHDLLHLTVGGHLHHDCELLWAATGEWVIDPAWYTNSPVRSYKPWDWALVLEFPVDSVHPEGVGKGARLERFIMELHPDKAEEKAAEHLLNFREMGGQRPIICVATQQLALSYARVAALHTWAKLWRLKRQALMS
ncbi:hypothetical protein WJX81_003610 [Elliptochloris bilobata]|uniref:Uncharacterized protein n=1 Tax=Elliptochloris bilobata TaxID=381761 RepID=A0AAW1SIW6_9CHLO